MFFVALLNHKNQKRWKVESNFHGIIGVFKAVGFILQGFKYGYRKIKISTKPIIILGMDK